MFLRPTTTTSTKNFFNPIDKLKQSIQDAEAIVIGAGSGLSTSAGFTYSGPRFKTYFADFEEKYGFHDMYSGGFYPYDTLEEYWAYWSRYIYINRYMDPDKSTYLDLFNIVKDKNYFVITTNVDHCFQKAGFDKDRLFYTQGDYGLFQCSRPCHNKTYDNEALIKEMVKSQKNMRIPSELIPVCPHCHSPMTMNLRSDNSFVEDEGWKKAAKRYQDFLLKNKHSKILYLEIGVGYNTPGIIKFSFWQLCANNKKSTYACINLHEAYAPKEIENRSICLQGDIDTLLKELN